MLRVDPRCALPLASLLLGAACASPPALPAPEVEYAGCSALLEPGRVCVLDDERQLWLWVGARSASEVELRIDGRRVEVPGERVREGWRFAPTLADGTRSVEVRTAGRAPWSLSVAGPKSERPAGSRDELDAVMTEARAIDAAMRDRDLAAMRRMLTGLRLPPQAPADCRYNVHYYLGMLAEREGDYRSALQEMQQAIAIAERVKLDAYRWYAEDELAVMLRGVGRSRDSARLFERLRRRPEGVTPCAEARWLNNQAWSELLAREAGERVADPAPLLEQALAKYETCKQVTAEKRANILLNLALAHLQEGRLPAAKELLARARALETHPPLPHRLWWLDLDGRIALRERRPADGLRSFAELENLAAQTTSSDGRLRALFGKAQSHRALGDRAAALATLVAAEELLDEQSLQVPVHEGRETFIAARKSIVDLHLELLLDQGRAAEALTAARQARSRILRQLAQGDRLAALPPEGRARRSRLLTDYQRRRAALEVRVSDEWKLPADVLANEEAGRRSEAQAVERLLDEAFLVLGEPVPRREELSPARAGELILAYHPLAGGWIGFAADDRGVAARRFDLPPELLARPAELGARLLLPFRDAIERAQRIRVVASGALEQVDFHALPFAGEVLLASRPVVYGLDLPAAAATAPAAGGRRALLVGDPRGDLPGAAAEARAVGNLLRSAPRPWTVDELGPTGASAAAVRGRLAGTDLFHYAGHGSFAGFGGWESSLLLTEDTRLTLGDLLALQAPPAWVMLSGCDTGRSAAETPVAGLGLAHAFLLAGSRAVVASTRPTADRSLPAFFTQLYTRWDREPDLAVALQRAQLAWRAEDPRADWSSFRLFAP